MPTEDGYDRTWLQDISYDGLKKLARVHGIEDDAEVSDIIDELRGEEGYSRTMPSTGRTTKARVSSSRRRRWTGLWTRRIR